MPRIILDAVRQREICAIIAVGGSRRTAAKYVGCAPASISNRALRDQDFARRLQRAEADFEVLLLSHIKQAGEKSWNAAAWLLERVYPERFGKRDPDTIPAGQLKEMLDRLVAVIKKEVRDPERVARLVAQMQEILLKSYSSPPRKTKKNGRS